MKEKGKYLELTLVISVIVFVSVLITIFITTKMVSEVPKSVDSASVTTELEDRIYDNAEIISCSDGLIVYKWNGQCYQSSGELEREYLGTADIEVKKHQIVRVKVNKQKTSDGMLMRVLLKNGDSIFHKSLFVSADSNIYINGKKLSKKRMSISRYMRKKNKTMVIVSTKKGKMTYGLNSSNLKKNGYEGSFTIIKRDEGYVIVNELPIEDYVRYVIASEMYSGAPMEALKAQAVCARTVAYSHLNGVKYQEYGADLDDSTSYQAYNIQGVTKRTDQAVKETKGKVLTYNNKFIECYYFSTSAGRTEDMEVWGSITPGYIKKVKSEDTSSPFYSWRAEINTEKYYDTEHGKLKKITIDRVSDSGYILKLTAVFDTTTVTYSKESDIRKFLGKYLAKLTLKSGEVRTYMTMLPSASFKIKSAKGKKIILQGAGYGHGIGLSQDGAEELARKGKTYKQILNYYYNNISIVSAKTVNGIMY